MHGQNPAPQRRSIRRPAAVQAKLHRDYWLRKWSGDGSCHVPNRVAPHYVGREDDFSDMVQVGLVPIRAASFVSVMIHRAAGSVGLPLTSYQLWSDDIEYTARIARHFTAIYVPQSVVLHATPANAGTLEAPPVAFVFMCAIMVGCCCGRRPTRAVKSLKSLSPILPPLPA